MRPADLSSLQQRITTCTQCPRLRKHCLKTTEVKRKAFLNDSYWGKPISGFGDPHARLMIVGLAPAAHGANRTGRIFTGDRSGEWLYRALYKAGFSNQPESLHRNDGLALRNTFVTCLVKCAPPDNQPSRAEQRRCSIHLEKELSLFSQTQVWIALGQIAYHGLWPLLSPESSRPKFQHGKKISLANGKTLLLSYHPSQQNTFTGRLTEPMFDSIFEEARVILI